MKKYDIVKTIIIEEGDIDDNFKNSLEKKLLNKLSNKFNIFTYMKKNILTVLVLVVLIAGGYIAYKETTSKNNNTEVVDSNEEEQTDNTSIANPASVYCEENGGNVVIEDEEEGQVGYCIFDSGKKCDEWSFYRGECAKE